VSAPKWTSGTWVAHPSTRYRGDIGYAWDIATGEATWDPNDYDRDEGERGAWQYPDNYTRLATTSDLGPDARAHAHLIAAAPELYAALERMLAAHVALFPGLRHIAVQDYREQNEAPIAARAALAKARGEG